MKVFLSHSSKDKPQVAVLATFLRANGIDAWLDQWEIAPGDDLVAKINDGLDRCAAGLIFLSGPANESPWGRAEVSDLVYARLREGKALIPDVGRSASAAINVSILRTRSPCSFMALKYGPEFPERFADVANGRAFRRRGRRPLARRMPAMPLLSSNESSGGPGGSSTNCGPGGFNTTWIGGWCTPKASRHTLQIGSRTSGMRDMTSLP